MFQGQNRLRQEQDIKQVVPDMEKEGKYLEKRLYKLTLAALKIIPMLLAFCAVTNMVLDFFGIDTTVISLFGGISFLPLLFLYLVSFAFRFCVYHRMFLHYILANNLITYYDFYIGIPVSNRTLFVIDLAVVCLFLFLILYFYRKEKCCKR